MATTKKEFVSQVVEEILENPRKILAGHGISAAVLQQIIKRPDVMARLASILWTLKAFKRGAKGLKKANGFQIKGYKNFPEMNMKAREDIEKFVATLEESDMGAFNNAENVATILMLPEQTTTDDENIGEEIASGKSLLIKFDTAVRREYKIPGGMYLVIMIADSAVRTSEEKAAKREAKKNASKYRKRTPARLKAELKAKAKRKLEILKKKRTELEDEAFDLNMEAEQSAYLEDTFGEDILGGIEAMNADAAQLQNVKAQTLAGLNRNDKRAYNYGMKLLKAGKKAAAKAVFATMSNPDIIDVINSKPTTGDDMVKARKAQLRKEIRALNRRGDQLLVDLSLAPENKKLSIRSMISKNSAKIKQLRAKLGTYKNLSAAGRANKAAMTAKVNDMIEQNIAAGENISQALNNALAAIDAKAAEKQIIKQQVMEQVADGMPIQYAVQQAVQQMPTQQQVVDDIDTTLTDDYTVEDLMNELGLS